MKTYPLLEKAPKDHQSQDFLNFITANNIVIEENGNLIIIENCKYHKPEAPHYTVFFKCLHFPYCPCLEGTITYLNEKYGDWQWLKKRASDQTVKRYHIHLIK